MSLQAPVAPTCESRTSAEHERFRVELNDALRRHFALPCPTRGCSYDGWRPSPLVLRFTFTSAYGEPCRVAVTRTCVVCGHHEAHDLWVSAAFEIAPVERDEPVALAA